MVDEHSIVFNTVNVLKPYVRAEIETIAKKVASNIENAKETEKICIELLSYYLDDIVESFFMNRLNKKRGVSQ